MVTPAARRHAAGFLQSEFEISERRAYSALSSCRGRRVDIEASGPKIRNCERLRQLAAERPRYGYRFLHELKRKGWAINHAVSKRGPGGAQRDRKHIAAARQQHLDLPAKPNQRWSMAFVSDALADGRVFQTLNIIDNNSRECRR